MMIRDFAREARYRIAAPNALARALMIVPIDPLAGRLAVEMAADHWENARFVSYAPDGSTWRAALQAEIFDMVVMLATLGQDLVQAIQLGETCIDRNVKISTVLLRPREVPVSALPAALRSVRPWSRTLAVLADDESVPGLLHALGA